MPPPQPQPQPPVPLHVNARGRARAHPLELIITMYIAMMFISFILSYLLSRSTYSDDFIVDFWDFVDSTPYSLQLSGNITDTQRKSSLLDKVHLVVQNEIWGGKPLWVSKMISVVIVVSYAVPKTLYFGFTLIFTCVCFFSVMRANYEFIEKLGEIVYGLGPDQVVRRVA